MKNDNRNLVLEGLPVSPGLAMGAAYVYRDILQREIEYYNIAEADADEEWMRIEDAVNRVCRDLRLTAEKVEKRVDNDASKIFLAQEAMLRDPALTEDLKKTFEEGRVNAEHVVKQAFLRWERKFEQLDREDLKQRGEDIADLARRLLLVLQGIHAHTLETVPPGSVLLAKRLLPSDTVFLSRRSTTAVAVEHGGRVSHAAILTREMGVPGVARIPGLLSRVETGDMVFVDGDSGKVIVRPDDALKNELYARVQDRWADLVRANDLSREKAVTRAGREITVLANVGCRDDIEHAVGSGADGVGLYRTEHLYLSRQSPPSLDTVVERIGEALTLVGRRPVVLRLLDAGGDKKVPFLNITPEQDPFLGLRGIRLLLQHEDLLRMQLRAFVRLGRDYDVRILAPMVTLADDMRRTRELLSDAAGSEGCKIPPLGAMVETPSAALCIEEIARHSDFLSIGTNDLTQYTMAAGRENPLVSDYFIDDHPAVMRLIQMVLDESGDRPVGICGELAGRTGALRSLLELGVRTLSVAPALIPELKQAIRGI